MSPLREASLYQARRWIQVLKIKKMIKTRTILMLLIIALSLVSSCTGSKIKKIAVAEKKCFMRVTSYDTEINGEEITLADTLYLSAEISGNKISGIHNWLPAEKDQMRGKYQGTILNDTATVLYDYFAEGENNTEELIFVILENQVKIGYGKKVRKGEVYVYEDKSKIYFTEIIPKTICK